MEERSERGQAASINESKEKLKSIVESRGGVFTEWQWRRMVGRRGVVGKRVVANELGTVRYLDRDIVKDWFNLVERQAKEARMNLKEVAAKRKNTFDESGSFVRCARKNFVYVKRISKCGARRSRVVHISK